MVCGRLLREWCECLRTPFSLGRGFSRSVAFSLVWSDQC